MGFYGLMSILITGSEEIPISDICADIITTAGCDYQIFVAKICYGGRVSYIFLKNQISALNNKHFTY